MSLARSAEQMLRDLEESARRATEKFRVYFPDCTSACRDRLSPKKADHAKLCRRLYEKPVTFMQAGERYPERLFLAANRTGKTETAAYEIACHLTGKYPRWWAGRRFTRPVKIWVSGDTNLSTRDILQVSLLGPIETYDTEQWAGMIPRASVHHHTKKSGGVPKCLHEVWVQHERADGEPDGLSMLEFKSFDQGRRLFQGTQQDVIWLDEECPLEVYTESLLRVMSTDGVSVSGLVMTTFTPLQGLTPFVQSFLETAVMVDQAGGLRPAFDHFFDQDGEATLRQEVEPTLGPAPVRLLVGATWDDAPHLTEEAKQQQLQSIPEYQRDARTKGIPQLGAGAIYPFPESAIRIEDFPIPRHWPKAFGFDCALAGTTAAVWGALDRDTGVVYVYSIYRRAQAETAVHAEAWKARGTWIPAVGDAADVIDADRMQFLDVYRRHGFDVELPTKTVETGIQAVYDRLSSQTLKVFASCGGWFEEFRLYRRDELGRVVKQRDHLMDATRYLIFAGLQRARTEPTAEQPSNVRVIDEGYRGLSWMQ